MTTSNYKRIAVVGASTANGQGDPENGGFAGRLRKWQEMQSTLENRKYFYNLGISANTSNDILDRVEKELKVRRVDCVIMQLGTNDCLRFDEREGQINTPLDEYKENVHDILMIAKEQIKTTKQEIGKVIVVGPYPIDEKKTCPVPWAPHYYRNDDIEKYSKALQRICEKMDVEYVDIWENFAAKSLTEYLYEDGLHLNTESHKYIFEKVIEKL